MLSSMKILLSIILLGFLAGCASTQYVDAKGRDCRNTTIAVFFEWSTCEEKQEPLAITRQETVIKADINGLK